jgi:peptidoglycan hydrolase CwlO-like protein
MDPEQNIALATIIKAQHKIVQALEDQAKRIGTMERTLQEILDEVSILTAAHEQRADQEDLED